MRSRFKKKIEGVKLLGYGRLARLVVWRIFWGGVRKNTEPFRGRYVKKLKAFSLCDGGVVVKAVVLSNPEERESIFSLCSQSFK